MDNQQKIKWYLIDTERTFCKVWDFLITCLTIYNLLFTPFVMVFPDIYTSCKEFENKTGPSTIGLDPGDYKDPTGTCISGVYEF